MSKEWAELAKIDMLDCQTKRVTGIMRFDFTS